MQLFYDKGARGPLLQQLNKCHLYLKAFHLSDITDFAGTYITDSAWQGTAPSIQINNFSWPRQGKPSPAAWRTWQTFLSQHIMNRHRRLTKPLGHWIQAEDWKWFFQPKDDRLYEKRGEQWYFYTKIPLRTRRLSFQPGGKDSPIGLLHKAFVIQKGQ